MNFPFMSVIIPTYCRERTLRDTLADVMRQEYPNFEILVIDQTPTHTPETQVYLEQLNAEKKIRWFRVDWTNLPRARNYGVCQAVGEIILFIDDDVQLTEHFLKAHARNYSESAEIGAVAGRSLEAAILKESHQNLSIEYLPPEAMDPAIAWYYIDLMNTLHPQQVITARGCNMSFRSEIFTKYKLWFDERFGGSAVREESDFCLRIRKTGYKIWYDPSATLINLGESTGGCHKISTQTLEYQIIHYHNHFLMAFNNLNFSESLRFFTRLFDCHVLGNPPCNKSRFLPKIFIRGVFYILGFISALLTIFQSFVSKI
ncbi:MAG: hormogonium polysaccharide biosynthesis glycosyltransferase HpsN [Trichodesmium sp. MAG_R02]|jgi:glycosyltransferase involved in cell wall biosynthesis|nr:hormogonium polysaccharide biosynthesis glycosyltransferase HpsN [Trichodesmium sp. MAG_R02]